MTTNSETKGQASVRLSFNPSGNPDVDYIKSLTAELIDFCENLRHRDARCAALAQTNYEQAAMWAVKAATAF